MNNNYIISKMSSKDEVQIAIDWMRQEGWNPGLYDAECFYATDPDGFFIGRLNDEVISVASAVIYDDNFAFCGCYIVKPEYRQKGYGIALTKARLDYVGERVTGLDGVLEMVDEYAKIGYEPVFNNIRYALEHPISSPTNANITSINSENIAKVVEYDRNYFPAQRYAFLNHWLQPKAGKALVYLDDDTVKGYVVARKCYAGYKIGPLFAESADIAEQLFTTVASQLDAYPILLDIPKPNKAARVLVAKYNMTQVFETIRMYRCGIPKLNLDNIFGITTFELG